MNTDTHTPDHGEPWVEEAGDIFTRIDDFVGDSYTGDGYIEECKQRGKRIVTCVNACAGMDDPTVEITSLRNALHLAESAYRDAIASSDKFESLYNDLRWLPLTRYTPTEGDANSCGDVEWSDGSDIWEAAYSNSKNATHWRSISLPSND